MRAKKDNAVCVSGTVARACKLSHRFNPEIKLTTHTSNLFKVTDVFIGSFVPL
jgi:hypothetical protein